MKFKFPKGNMLAGIKKHPILTGVIIVLIIGATVQAFGSKKDQSPEQDSEQETPVTLLSVDDMKADQIVASASGEIESLNEVSLSSEMFGTVTGVYAHIGDHIKAGQLLVQFRAADKAAQRTQVQADYENALASKNSLLAQIDAAHANHEKLKITVQSNITAAETALRTAQNNLQEVEQTGTNVQVNNAYTDTALSFQTINNSFVDLLGVADAILGIDNTFVNDDYEDILGVTDVSTLPQAQQQYYLAREAKNSFAMTVRGVSSATSHDQIDDIIVEANADIRIFEQLFIDLTQLLDNTPPIGDLSQSKLDGLVASVNSGRAKVNSLKTALTASTQAITTAKQSFSGAEIAYEKAVQDLADTKARSQAEIAASEADLKRLESTLASQEASIKRALGSIAAVNAELAKASVRSPISGEVAAISVKLGESVSNGAPVAKIVNTNGLQVTAYVPSSALASLAIGGTVNVEGQPIGHIVRIAPSINDATKKVEVIVGIDDDADHHFVVGQFVNLEMLPAEHVVETPVLLVPLTAVKVTAESHSVFVVEDGKTVAVQVETGTLVGDKIEIFTDLSAYNTIISSVRGIEAGEAVTIVE